MLFNIVGYIYKCTRVTLFVNKKNILSPFFAFHSCMNFKIKFFLFIIFLTGFLFVIRILIHFHQKRLVHKSALTKIGTLYFIYLVALSRMHLNLLMMSLMTWMPLLVLILGEPILRRWRHKKFRERFYFYLSEVILTMRVGSPFRTSLMQVNNEVEDIFFQMKMKEVIDFVVFSQQVSTHDVSSFIQGVVREFKKVDEQPHRGLDRLENLRRKLYIESDFRRRSGQILMQTRMQAFIMAGLYFAVLIFVLFRYEWRDYLRLISISGWLFGVGFMWILQAGKKKKWMV